MRKQATETDRALRMIQRGVDITVAAAKCGVAPSTIYRAAKRAGLAIGEAAAKLKEPVLNEQKISTE